MNMITMMMLMTAMVGKVIERKGCDAQTGKNMIIVIMVEIGKEGHHKTNHI